MDILLVAATFPEIEQTCNHLGITKNDMPLSRVNLTNLNLEILITGVGMVATTYELTKALMLKKYDLAINAGIAGCLDIKVELGTVFQVTKDEFYEMGAEDNDKFLSIFDLKLNDRFNKPFTNGKICNEKNTILKDVPTIGAITVNKVHGNKDSINLLSDARNGIIESMEGAAFAYTCSLENVKYIQLRAVSNYIEARNRDAWQIGVAIKNLNDTLIGLIKTLQL